MTADNYRFYLQNRLFQTGQTGPPLVFPALILVMLCATAIYEVLTYRASLQRWCDVTRMGDVI